MGFMMASPENLLDILETLDFNKKDLTKPLLLGPKAYNFGEIESTVALFCGKNLGRIAVYTWVL